MRRLYASTSPIYQNVKNHEVGAVLTPVAFQIAISSFVGLDAGSNVLYIEGTAPEHGMDDISDHPILN
jgi:hypothetical protein